MNGWYATKIAREWNVQQVGVGNAREFDVDAEYLERFAVHQSHSPCAPEQAFPQPSAAPPARVQ